MLELRTSIWEQASLTRSLELFLISSKSQCSVRLIQQSPWRGLTSNSQVVKDVSCNGKANAELPDGLQLGNKGLQHIVESYSGLNESEPASQHFWLLS